MKETYDEDRPTICVKLFHRHRTDCTLVCWMLVRIGESCIACYISVLANINIQKTQIQKRKNTMI